MRVLHCRGQEGRQRRWRRLHKKCQLVGGHEDGSQGGCEESLAIVESPDPRGREEVGEEHQGSQGRFEVC